MYVFWPYVRLHSWGDHSYIVLLQNCGAQEEANCDRRKKYRKGRRSHIGRAADVCCSGEMNSGALISFVTLPILLSKIFHIGPQAASFNFPGTWSETLRPHLQKCWAPASWRERSAWSELFNRFQIWWWSGSSIPETRYPKIDYQCLYITKILLCNLDFCIVISVRGVLATNSTGDWLSTSASLQCSINFSSSLLLWGLQSNIDYCHLCVEQRVASLRVAWLFFSFFKSSQALDSCSWKAVLFA